MQLKIQMRHYGHLPYLCNLTGGDSQAPSAWNTGIKTLDSSSSTPPALWRPRPLFHVYLFAGDGQAAPNLSSYHVNRGWPDVAIFMATPLLRVQRTLLPEEKPLVLIVRTYLVHFQHFVVRNMMAISSIERPDRGRAPSAFSFSAPKMSPRSNHIWLWQSTATLSRILFWASQRLGATTRDKTWGPRKLLVFYWDRLFVFGRQTWCYIYNVGQQFVHTSRDHRTSKLQSHFNHQQRHQYESFRHQNKWRSKAWRRAFKWISRGH